MNIPFDGELLLAGGGDADDSRPIDERLVEQIGAGATMAYVPVAMPSERYSDCEEWITSVFDRYGLTAIETWTQLSTISAEDVANVSAVYIGGGNTYRLLERLRATGTDQLLRDFVSDGGTLYGGSAGAIVCGATIETTPDKNYVGLSDLGALGLLPDVDVWCHYVEDDDPEIREYVATTGRPVVALPERSGVSMTTTRYEVVGHDPVSVFDEAGKATKLPGEQFYVRG